MIKIVLLCAFLAVAAAQFITPYSSYYSPLYRSNLYSSGYSLPYAYNYNYGYGLGGLNYGYNYNLLYR